MLSRPSYEQLAALVVEQAAAIERLERRVADLEAETGELRRWLALNSRNSSRPPSSDGLAKPPVKSLRRPLGRKPGGQPGYDGGHLAQVAAPDEIVDHLPALCGGCRTRLDDAIAVAYQARQVFDLPEIRLVTVEHRAWTRRCGCGQETTAALPAKIVAPAQYGPRVRALGLYLVAYQHLPYGRAAQLLSDWLGQTVSTGTLVAFMAQAANDLRPFLNDVHAQITAAPVAHFDETGARAAGQLRWLFSASTDRLTFYSLHDKRGFDGLDHAGLLPLLTGVAVHDGYQPYRRYSNAQHALCNVHHLRELLGIIEPNPDDPKIAWAVHIDQLLREMQAAVTHARAAGASQLDHEALARYRAAYARIITDGNQRDPPRQTPARNLLTRLDRDREHVLRFAHNFRVPFDNNLAERDIRMIKLQQKISGCRRTITGAKQFLTLRAYLSTAHKNSQPTLNALTALGDRRPWTPAT